MTIKNLLIVDAQQYTILVIDDNISNIKVIANYLRTFNFRILVATSGERALRQIQHITPDLILLDVIMPNMDGWETCRRLKADEKTKDIPVIFITALASEDDKVNAFEEGGVDYITKPIQLREVLARVMTHLRLSNLQKKLETQNAKLQQELDLACKIQQNLLLPPSPTLKNINLSCYSTSAYKIGSSWYNYWQFNDKHFGIAVGDTSSKGTVATLFMTTCLTNFQNSLSHSQSPAELMLSLNNAITPLVTTANYKCAVCYVELKQATDNLENTWNIVVSNVGGIPPYIKRKDGAVTLLAINDPPLGKLQPSNHTYNELQLKLQTGDMLILMTNGILNVNNPNNEPLNFERLELIIKNAPVTSPLTMVEHLKQKVMNFSGKTEPLDNITIMVAQV